MINMRVKLIIVLFCIINVCGVCTQKDNGPDPNPPNPPPATGAPIEYWLTAADQSTLLQKQSVNLQLSSPTNVYPYIDVDSATAMQTIDGFGYTLTGGSAQLINRMGATEKQSLL
jgi:glucosylceramidase